ncbi:MAG: hypothetical protein WC635_10895 [Bacteriovorax sp.]|jgi:hypothetical protein
MKKLTGGIIVLMFSFITACSSTPSDPHKPEMSVDRNPSQSKTYNQFHNEWEN